jgi:hypothetical protein
MMHIARRTIVASGNRSDKQENRTRNKDSVHYAFGLEVVVETLIAEQWRLDKNSSVVDDSSR